MNTKDKFEKISTYLQDNHNITRQQYQHVHNWLKYNFGKAVMCENINCEKKSLRFHWALKRGYKYEKNRNNFLQLCQPCHVRYDVTEKTRKKLAAAVNVKTLKKCVSCGLESQMKKKQVFCEPCRKERRQETNKNCFLRNPDAYRNRNSRYKRENKDKINAYQRKRYHIMKLLSKPKLSAEALNIK